MRQAAAQGAQIILLQELFGGPYFCQVSGGCLEYESACEVIHPSASSGLSSLVCNPQEILDTYFSWARTTQDSEIVNHFKKVAAELKVVSVTC